MARASWDGRLKDTLTVAVVGASGSCRRRRVAPVADSCYLPSEVRSGTIRPPITDWGQVVASTGWRVERPVGRQGAGRAMDSIEKPSDYQSSIDYIHQRRTESDERLGKLSKSIVDLVDEVRIEGLGALCVGSYARGEGLADSDLDLFFLVDEEPDTEGAPPSATAGPAYCDQCKRMAFHLGSAPKVAPEAQDALFNGMVRALALHGFPELSNQGQYALRIHPINAALPLIGGPQEDLTNYFTVRLLLLLEGRPIAGMEALDKYRDRVAAHYYRDSGGKRTGVQPLSLYNDIRRYWTTVLANYEYWITRGLADTRNEPTVYDSHRAIRSLKLAFPRKTTCAASIAYIAARVIDPDADPFDEMVGFSPIERLVQVSLLLPESEGLIQDIVSLYAWSLRLTSDSDALERSLASRETRGIVGKARTDYAIALYELFKLIDAAGARASERTRTNELLASLLF